MATSSKSGYRLAIATGLHKGDRSYQQDQVEVLVHQRVPGCALAVVADGMGGKSGGRKAADQVVLTAKQVFERFAPGQDDPVEMLTTLANEAHMVIKLTAISAEEEPHSTIAAFLVYPTNSCDVVHAGDSRVYHFRGPELLQRTTDHSFVQRLVDEGRISETEANVHPQSNLLTGCLGTAQDPPVTHTRLQSLQVGDTLMACSDGLWHYFTPHEMGSCLADESPREAAEHLISLARERARGGGDNISIAIVKVESLK